MAIALDQSLGTVLLDVSSNTLVLTTTATAASNTCIFLGCHIYDSPASTITSVVDDGPGLTWTVDKEGLSGLQNLAIVSAQAPSGMASGTDITITWSISRNARIAGAVSFTGVKASGSIVDGTPLGPTSDASGTWSSGSYAIAAGSIIIGLGASLNLTGSNSPTNPSLEAWESINVPDAYGLAMVYRIEASAGSYAVGGTFAGATSSGNIAVAYLAAADEPPAGTRIVHPRRARGISW